MNEKRNQRQSEILFGIWFAVLAGLILYYSFEKNAGFRYGVTKEMGLVISLMLNLLSLMMLFTGDISLMKMIPWEVCINTDLRVRKKYALKIFLITLCMTALLLGYCLAGRYLLRWTSDIRNCLVEGAIFCIGVLITREVRIIE